MSLTDYLHVILDFISLHQMWALPIVFLLAFGESLALISLLIPATALLLGAGGLIGAGAISFFPILISATLGAILGDFISYWLGKHYHTQVLSTWPLKNYPKLIAKSEIFFLRYGVLGVFIGRFFGPFRAIVPLIAGTFHMPAIKFNIANIVSAPLWVFVLLAPGAYGIAWLETLFG